MADVTAPANAPKPEPEKNFNKAAEKKPEQQPKPEQPKVQSEQVKNTQHGLQGGPKPPGSTRDAVVRDTHNKAKAKDDKKSKEASSVELEELKHIHARAKARKNSQENDKTPDRGR